jgi:hypothetical protein
MIAKPNGVAVINSIATGFNLWSRNEKEFWNAVGMGYVFEMNNSNYETGQVSKAYRVWDYIFIFIKETSAMWIVPTALVISDWHPVTPQ